MSIHIGSFGRVMLQRKFGDTELLSVVNPSDVNATKKRFSFDFDQGILLTGDQIEITSTNNAVLAFISASAWANNTQQSSFKAFIHVDELGGIRFYSSYANSINGGSTNAISLASISSNIPIKVKVANAISRILGQVTSYELNLVKENVDLTVLSDQYRTRYSTLASGSGRITCAWDYKDTTGGGEHDTPQYLIDLINRTKVGSEFGAHLFWKTSGYNPDNTAGATDDIIYFDVNAVLTSVVSQVNVSAPIDMTAEFITTGKVEIKVATAAEYKLLQEDSGLIRLDQDASANLLISTE